MSQYIIQVTEIYRVDSEHEAEELIKDLRRQFTVSKYNCEHKEKKVKGEVVDEWYKVTVVKQFNDEKEPEKQYDITYQVKEF